MQEDALQVARAKAEGVNYYTVRVHCSHDKNYIHIQCKSILEFPKMPLINIQHAKCETCIPLTHKL